LNTGWEIEVVGLNRRRATTAGFPESPSPVYRQDKVVRRRRIYHSDGVVDHGRFDDRGGGSPARADDFSHATAVGGGSPHVFILMNKTEEFA
jgi:hypothetical protein